MRKPAVGHHRARFSLSELDASANFAVLQEFLGEDMTADDAAHAECSVTWRARHVDEIGFGKIWISPRSK
jgi:hypothetical protein